MMAAMVIPATAPPVIPATEEAEITELKKQAVLSPKQTPQKSNKLVMFLSWQSGAAPYPMHPTGKSHPFDGLHVMLTYTHPVPWTHWSLVHDELSLQTVGVSCTQIGLPSASPPEQRYEKHSDTRGHTYGVYEQPTPGTQRSTVQGSESTHTRSTVTQRPLRQLGILQGSELVQVTFCSTHWPVACEHDPILHKSPVSHDLFTYVHTPLACSVSIVQLLPSLHVMGVYTQPSAGSHESIVSGLPSTHDSVVLLHSWPLTQDPMRQRLPVVQLSGTYWQPRFTSQESCVQVLRSSQITGTATQPVVVLHDVTRQRFAEVQFTSLESHRPVAGLHQKLEQLVLDGQTTLVVYTQAPATQESDVQAFWSLQRTLTSAGDLATAPHPVKRSHTGLEHRSTLGHVTLEYTQLPATQESDVQAFWSSHRALISAALLGTSDHPVVGLQIARSHWLGDGEAVGDRMHELLVALH